MLQYCLKLSLSVIGYLLHTVTGRVAFYAIYPLLWIELDVLYGFVN